MSRAVMAVLAIVVSGCATERCRNEIAQRATSPDRAHDAVLYHRDCGQGAGSDVAIIPHGADLPDLPTSVLTLSQPVHVAMTWASPTEVVLRFPPDAKVIARQERSLDGIDVRFDAR